MAIRVPAEVNIVYLLQVMYRPYLLKLKHVNHGAPPPPDTSDSGFLIAPLYDRIVRRGCLGKERFVHFISLILQQIANFV